MTVRLDLLHIINRAHHEARGKFLGEDDLDLGGNETESNEERSNIDSQGYMIKELIYYIQDKVKVFRNGLEYSKFKEMSSGIFKRPKVWSNTKMVVYDELEMVEGFLENSVF